MNYSLIDNYNKIQILTNKFKLNTKMSIEVADQLNQESAMEKLNDDDMRSSQQDLNASKTLLSQNKQRSLNAEQDAQNNTTVMSKMSQDATVVAE
jgi:hypothetical protein